MHSRMGSGCETLGGWAMVIDSRRLHDIVVRIAAPGNFRKGAPSLPVAASALAAHGVSESRSRAVTQRRRPSRCEAQCIPHTCENTGKPAISHGILKSKVGADASWPAVRDVLAVPTEPMSSRQSQSHDNPGGCA